ncbi:hypothetical protein D6D13_10040 [Aureobasidium pullulans]|uniref:BTB domain-containing protein n=1 Tax=Aureobasidium pullulans TaxID=5580 RepID=A0A4V4IY79_AURPU|nr:hypothetical protein D6D13_10040 [Aureobasidium pullulans]
MASSTDTNAGALKRKRNFFNDEELSDVIIMFGEEQVFAHKVILASGSIWFEKALLGNFSVMILITYSINEAKKKVVELHDDTGPDAIMAMLKHIYGLHLGNTFPEWRDGDGIGCYLEVYAIGDKYDVESLREQVTPMIREELEMGFIVPKIAPVFLEITIDYLQKILGPSAVQYADKTLVSTTKELVLKNSDALMRAPRFQAKMALGEMFYQEFGIILLQTVCESLRV